MQADVSFPCLLIPCMYNITFFNIYAQIVFHVRWFKTWKRYPTPRFNLEERFQYQSPEGACGSTWYSCLNEGWSNIQLTLVVSNTFNSNYCFKVKINFRYSKCPKISNTKVPNKMACANSAEPDQTALKEHSDQALQFTIPLRNNCIKAKFWPKKYGVKWLKFQDICRNVG